jgi:hypothetical protein
MPDKYPIRSLTVTFPTVLYRSWRYFFRFYPANLSIHVLFDYPSSSGTSPSCIPAAIFLKQLSCHAPDSKVVTIQTLISLHPCGSLAL